MNMSDTITISYIWDKETYLKASKLAYSYELKHSTKRYIGWFFIAMLQFGVVAAMKKGAIGLLLISTVMLTYWYILRWPIRKKIIERTFDKSPNANLQYIINLLPDGLKINDKLITWGEITQTLAIDDGIFVSLSQESIFIPSHAFKTIEERNYFLKRLKSNISDYKREA